MDCSVSIDHQACSECGTCLELCPQVFCSDDDGTVHVLQPDRVPQAALEQAVAWCPEQCILVEQASARESSQKS